MKLRSILLSELCFFLFIPVICTGSPIPGMGSSALAAPEKGIFFSRWGFQLNNKDTAWGLNALESKNDQMAVQYKSTSGKAALSVHTDLLKSNYSLENYAKRWTRDYSNYGFEFTGTKIFQQNNARGLVVDLVHKKKGQQLRQVIFLKDKTSVILTCQSEIKTFLQNLPVCNQIIRSFSWVNSSPGLTPQKAF